jgi:hypothetical protein
MFTHGRCPLDGLLSNIYREVSYCHKAKDSHRGQAATCLCARRGGNKQSGAGVGVLSNKGLAEPGGSSAFGGSPALSRRELRHMEETMKYLRLVVCAALGLGGGAIAQAAPIAASHSDVLSESSEFVLATERGENRQGNRNERQGYRQENRSERQEHRGR